MRDGSQHPPNNHDSGKKILGQKLNDYKRLTDRRVDFKRLIDKLRAERSLSAEELRQLIDGYDDETLVYAAAAARAAVTEAHFGDGVYLRGADRGEQPVPQRLPLLRAAAQQPTGRTLPPGAREEILAARAAGLPRRAGVTFCIAGGRGPPPSRDALLVPLIAEIHRRWPDCAPLTLARRAPDASYEALYAAGATRYLLRHETIDEAHYRLLHPDDMSLARRSSPASTPCAASATRPAPA